MKTYMILIGIFVGMLFCAFDQKNTINDPEYVDLGLNVNKNSINGHEYVDLGLSVKWAACNIGADSPEEYGDYFGWGETEKIPSLEEILSLGKIPLLDNNNCKTRGKSMGDIRGNANYDAARANWGGRWRMPTAREFGELGYYCDWEWVTPKGDITGYKVTSKRNGNSIFLPAAGWKNMGLRLIPYSIYGVGSCGRYWSSMPDRSDTTEAYFLGFDSDAPNGYYGAYRSRCDGFSIRPVLE